MTRLLSLALLACSALPVQAPPVERLCYPSRVTGYVRGAHSPWTYDGTSIWTPEPIAASAWDLPLNSLVWIEDVGTVRIADRGGGLGAAGWIDVAVWSHAEAVALTGMRTICVTPPA